MIVIIIIAIVIVDYVHRPTNRLPLLSLQSPAIAFCWNCVIDLLLFLTAVQETSGEEHLEQEKLGR
jgi:hypothetical protein